LEQESRNTEKNWKEHSEEQRRPEQQAFQTN